MAAKKPLIDEAPAGIWKIMIFRCFDGAAIKLPANYQMNDSSSIGSEDMTNSAMDISVDENSSHHSISSYLLHTSLNTNDIYEHQMTASGYMVYSDTNSELDSMSFGEDFSLNNISFITHSKGEKNSIYSYFDDELIIVKNLHLTDLKCHTKFYHSMQSKAPSQAVTSRTSKK
ncbi:hypothetical protein WUBG_02381 [Wuchereria bancrofti]|uniref:Uncharacterized protein n=1 Tax=Wuchereria bancrofti TaxID=6293 RepID=J9FH95_WUCBA|nr:hypothetical protein WUBG_02381 [Wuchereria bancrofti]